MKTKRIAALGLAALMTGSLLTGCGGSTSSSTSAASASGNTDTAASASASADLSSTSSVPTSTTASSATTTEGKKASDIKVAGMIYLEDNFMKMLAAGFKAAAQDAGVNYTEFNCNQDQAAESETIATYASQGMDGIAIAPLNEDSSIESLKSAASTGTKIVLCDSTLENGDFLTGGYTSDQKQLGASTGKAAVKWLQDNVYTADNPCPIAVVCFDSLLPTKSGDRVDGFLDTVGDLVTVVDREDAWEQDKAQETVQNIMTAHPEIKMIYGANDGGTLGATAALENNGYAGQVVVFGIDASKQMVQLLQDDYNVLQAVTGQDAYTMGQDAMKLLIDTLEGKDTGVEPGQTENVDGVLLTRDDSQGLNDYLDMWDSVVGE